MAIFGTLVFILIVVWILKIGIDNKKSTPGVVFNEYYFKSMKEELDEKRTSIREKIKKIIELREISIKLEDNPESELLIKQETIIKYLTSYYEKYSLALLYYCIEIESNKCIEMYNETKDITALYDNLIATIQKCYRLFESDVYIYDKKRLIQETDSYITKIKSTLKKVVIENTNSIIDNISPITDNQELARNVRESLTSEVDITKLNESYDKFLAELSVL